MNSFHKYKNLKGGKETLMKKKTIEFCLINLFVFIVNYVYVWVCAHGYRSPKRSTALASSGAEITNKCEPLWVLKTKLGSSEKAVCSLAAEPSPQS